MTNTDDGAQVSLAADEAVVLFYLLSRVDR
jgi:hypothetical protein